MLFLGFIWFCMALFTYIILRWRSGPAKLHVRARLFGIFARKNRSWKKNAPGGWRAIKLNPFTTGNPFLGTKLLGFSIWRGSGALKGLSSLHFTSVFILNTSCVSLSFTCKCIIRSQCSLIYETPCGRGKGKTRTYLWHHTACMSRVVAEGKQNPLTSWVGEEKEWWWLLKKKQNLLGTRKAGQRIL